MRITLQFTPGQIKVISAVLSDLAATWLASIAVLPGIFGVRSVTDAVILLTYSLSFATLSIYLAAKLEDKLL